MRAPRAPAAPPRRSPPPPGLATRSGSRSSRKSPPLNRPPTIATTPPSKALDRSPRRLDVGRLRVVDEPHAADPTDGLHHVLETVKPAQARASSRRAARRPPMRDGSGGDHVVQHVPAGQLHRRHGNQPLQLDVPCACTIQSPSTTKPSASRSERREHARACAAMPRAARHHRRVVGVDDRPVARPLIREDARLGCRVRLDGRDADRGGRRRS